MSNKKSFPCAADCDSVQLGPCMMSDYECNCHNAEIARLMSVIFKMTIELDSLKDIRAMEPVAINTLRANNRTWEKMIADLEAVGADQRTTIYQHEGKIAALMDRILELESNQQAWMSKESAITADNLRLSGRVKELEEAMPKADTMRAIARLLSPFNSLLTAKAVDEMADRIEKVMAPK